MPTDSPHLAKQLKPLAVAMSPMLWSRFKPDRFDSYSTGKHGLPHFAHFVPPPLINAAELVVAWYQTSSAAFGWKVSEASQTISLGEGGACWLGPGDCRGTGRMQGIVMMPILDAGLVMMQLAMPRLRSSSAIKSFNNQFRRCVSKAVCFAVRLLS